MNLHTLYSQMKDQNLTVLFKCFLLIIVFLLSFLSCDDSFQPLKENNLYSFNISGYLDASADTQWVRVGTIRESIEEAPNPDGIQVTLEDMETGETVVMKDSVFVYRNVLNYWTTMDIKNEQTYRIVVEGTDDNPSHVTLTTPKKLPSVFITENRDPLEYYIYIDDAVEHIADLQSVWYVIINPGSDNQRRTYRFPLRNTLRPTFAYFGSYRAYVSYKEELSRIQENTGNAEIEVVARQFFVASAGPEWVDSLSSIDDLEYFLDGTASNVENGLGFVAGIDAKWFKQEACLTPDESNYIPCEPKEPFLFE